MTLVEQIAALTVYVKLRLNGHFGSKWRERESERERERERDREREREKGMIW